MPLSPGDRFGPYEILAPIGAGGMGEVYRGRDSKLGRDVAIKVLPDSLANDADYMTRFQREAQVLASLNHPNIAHIYGLEGRAIVMELVEGPTLADRIEHGPIPIEETIAVARQIAEAFEYAHEKGVIHRDLKPANVKITPEGMVKVLDFGLAKLDAPAVPAANPETSPTLTLRATQAGLILGTAAYMAPEQARGDVVDRRADVWAFGAVLFEMLSGKMAFPGDSVTDILASVVKLEPEWNWLPPSTPAHIRRLVERCLTKDRKRRLQAIGEARIAMEEAGAGPVELSHPKPSTPWLWMAAAVVATAVVFTVGFFVLRNGVAEPKTMKLSMVQPDNTQFNEQSIPAVSPDGRRIAFSAMKEGKSALWVRDLDSLTAREMPGTEGAGFLFWSPDSRSIAFFDGKHLKRVDARGGSPLTICEATNGRGGTWSTNGVIVFEPTFFAALWRVPAAGGTPVELTTLDRQGGEFSHRWPWFLPDGRHYLYLAPHSDSLKSTIYVGDLESKERRAVVIAASNAVYAPPGFLLYTREGTLLAQPFDAAGARTTGEAFPVAEAVASLTGSRQAGFSVSQNGLLVYASGGVRRSQLTFFDRDGAAVGTVGAPGDWYSPALSPDGGTIAVSLRDPGSGTRDLWLHNLARGTVSRFTSNPGTRIGPIWLPDGSGLLFSAGLGLFGIYQKRANGTGPEERLSAVAPISNFAADVSQDGRFLVYVAYSDSTDIWVLPLTGEKKTFPFAATQFRETQARISPDGQWLAYASNETGRFEIYVDSFPKPAGMTRVSTEGGNDPVWSRDGKELFYIASDGKLMAVPTKTEKRFGAGAPKALFEARLALGQRDRAQYDVTPDGRRFLIAAKLDTGSEPPMTVVVNWLAGFKR